jgi:hypothetical protein
VRLVINSYYNHLRRIISICCLILAFSLFPANSVVAQSNVQLFMSDSTPFGIPYNEWTAKWWTWLMSIPLSENPAADSTGEFCAKNQNQTGPVWFLAGTFQSLAERSCEIPTGKGILLPVLNVECSFAESPNLKTDSELSQCAKELVDKVTFVQASVDGVEVQNIIRTQSPPFTVTFPEQNIFGVQAGPTRAVSDGFWVFLQPLSPGSHTINFKGAVVDVTTTGVASITNDVTYHLTLVAVPEGANQTQSIPLQE